MTDMTTRAPDAVPHPVAGPTSAGKCERCGRADYDGIHVPAARETVPTMSQLEEWVIDGVAEAVDGCMVEPDGRCEHDSPSWLIKLGLI